MSKSETSNPSINLKTDTLNEADRKYAILGFSSRSQFVQAAVEEYLDRHSITLEMAGGLE